MQGAINFAIYASSASSVSLVLFSEDDLQAGRTTHEMELDPELNRTGSVWHIMLPKLDTTLLYGACHTSPSVLCVSVRLQKWELGSPKMGVGAQTAAMVA